MLCAAAVLLQWRGVAWLGAQACCQIFVYCGGAHSICGRLASAAGTAPQRSLHFARPQRLKCSFCYDCPSSILISKRRVWCGKATRDVALVDVAVSCM